MQTNSTRQRLMRSTRQGIRATVLGVMASAVLAGVKVVSGVVGHSYALIADGVESLLDVFSSLIVLGSLQVASFPPTEKHPYGYGKAEALGAMVIALALVVAAVGIAVQSVREIVTPHRAPALFTLPVLLLVVLAKETLFRRLLKTGSEIGSRALETDAWHHRSDALTSVAAFIGISIALIGGEGFESADDWAALFACGLIAYNGFRLFRNALAEVLDVAASPETIETIRQCAEQIPGIIRLDLIRVRNSGLGLFIDLHVEVDANLSVIEGHALAHDVKGALMESKALVVLDALVHVEPNSQPDAPH